LPFLAIFLSGCIAYGEFDVTSEQESWRFSENIYLTPDDPVLLREPLAIVEYSTKSYSETYTPKHALRPFRNLHDDPRSLPPSVPYDLSEYTAKRSQFARVVGYVPQGESIALRQVIWVNHRPAFTLKQFIVEVLTGEYRGRVFFLRHGDAQYGWDRVVGSDTP